MPCRADWSVPLDPSFMRALKVQPHTPIHSSKRRLTLSGSPPRARAGMIMAVLCALQSPLRLPVTLHCGNVPGRGWMLFISGPQA